MGGGGAKKGRQDLKASGHFHRRRHQRVLRRRHRPLLRPPPLGPRGFSGREVWGRKVPIPLSSLLYSRDQATPKGGRHSQSVSENSLTLYHLVV